jgi:PilZ domain
MKTPWTDLNTHSYYSSEDTMNSNQAYVERRRSQRSFLSEKASCEPFGPRVPSRVKLNHPSANHNSRIKNVSEGGVGLVTTERLQIAQVVKINLSIPSIEATIPTLAEARWVKKVSGRPNYRVGLRFLL